MQVGFFFWPFSPDLVGRVAEAAEGFGFDMIGIADTPGNAMDPWIAATLVAQATTRSRISLCVSNLTSRHPAASAAAIASLDLLAPDRAILGIGTGHSGTTNLGLPRSTIAEMEAGTRFMQALLAGQPATWQGRTAHLPWVKRPSPVFVAASGPKALGSAGATANGAFVNFGIDGENLKRTEAAVRQGAAAVSRNPDDVEVWQIAALDCNRDGTAARQRIGAILAFMAGGYILQGDPTARGVPAELCDAIGELRRRYSTRPGAADAALVDELGLFDYLSRRFAIYGTPEQCRDQMLAAQAAGLSRVMFTVSLAADPVATVELFGREVLPALQT
ncbi:MAG: LLM class flavin-dependent oxidoreductase [Alphaproteobacteria bacterium]|nr:LLM class flavin-dependent oxidoreductase [Alphaproteobacteria bacterium]